MTGRLIRYLSRFDDPQDALKMEDRENGLLGGKEIHQTIKFGRLPRSRFGLPKASGNLSLGDLRSLDPA
jgi:hypothetical protein